MKRKERALIEALDRVGDFLAKHEAVVAPALTDSARDRFTALAQRLMLHVTAQATMRHAVRDQTRIKRELRRVLVEEHMRPIALLGLAELGVSATTFRVPPVRSKYTDVVAMGYGLAEAAAKYKDALVAAGLPGEFLERLVAATDALRDAVKAKSDVTAQSVEATALLRKDGRLARLRLRALDIAIRSAIKPDQSLHDRWVNISRIAAAAATAVASDATPTPGPTPSAPSPIPIPESTTVAEPVTVETGGGGEGAALGNVAA